MDPKTVHVIVSLMASEVDGAPGSAHFSLSFFVPNSPDGPQLFCFGTGLDATQHLNALTRFWTTMSFAVTLLDRNEDNWLPQGEMESINLTRHSWPYEWEEFDDSRGGFVMSKTLSKNGLNKRNDNYFHICVTSLLTGNLLNALIACRSFFCDVKLPDGHNDEASEEADKDLCNLVAAAISVGYWSPLVKVCISLFTSVFQFNSYPAGQHHRLLDKMGPERLWSIKKLGRWKWGRLSLHGGWCGHGVQGTSKTWVHPQRIELMLNVVMDRNFPSRRSLKSGYVLWHFSRPQKHNLAGDLQVTDKWFQACPRYEEMEQFGVLDHQHENSSEHRGSHGPDTLWQGYECFAWIRETFARKVWEFARRQSRALNQVDGSWLDTGWLRMRDWVRWMDPDWAWGGWEWGWCGQGRVSGEETIKLDLLIGLLKPFFSAKALKLK